ncbi:polyhomeotic-like protein 3 [Anabas testudineus]|uniref:polyhomeotic-like protein 3 n=1 Tax=Anabas testudineus TaxID=64144 RepID=UPI000E457407|nr:polyhomeotic-like protein 3 [Anabas testudineus]
MERRSPGEKQADTNRAAATTTTTTTTATTSAAVTMATVPSSSTTCTLAPSTSLSIMPPDRQAVQVIQHTIHRPQSMAAQYLHQMYAAQQQHLMLQTAALQQHQHTPHLQSLATIQQASVCQRQSTSSSPGGLVQPAGVSQNSITVPASPVTAQLIGRSQASNSSAAATTISQQAMLLGNRPVNCNQAQMYLRTQMLILTPAATVAAVQSDLPAVTSCSSLPTSSQNLALRAHLPGALATAHSVILKPSAQSHGLSPATSLSKTSICAVKTNQLTDTSETGPRDVPRLASGPQIITPAFCPVQTHALVKQQLSCPAGQQVAHHQFILQQQTTGGAPSPRQLQPIALRVASQETYSSPLPLSVKRLTTPSTPSTTTSSSSSFSSSSSSSSSSSVTSVFTSSSQTSIPAATVQPQPPPLVAAPQHRTSFPQVQNQPPPPPPPLVLPRLPHNPPASLQRLSLHSVQALAVQSGQMLLTEQELPVAEALVQMPYQNLPPPQTVAVDLKVHSIRRNETSSSGQTCKVNVLSSEERKDGHSACPQKHSNNKTPIPLTVPPKQNGEAVTLSSHSAIRSPQVEEPSQLTTTSSSSSSNPPPLPPPVLPAAIRGPSQPPSAPSSLPGSPERIRTTHVLTHLIEGFVIQEGLESFPVGPSSVLTDQQTSLSESQEMQANGDAAAEDSPLDADQSDSDSDTEMENDGPAADVAELGDSVAGVLQCEYCGNRGYAHTFVRSKRFCSMTCVRRFSVSCTKRISLLRSGRWGHRPTGRRGRPRSRVNGASRDHFLRQVRRSRGSEETQRSSLREEEEEEQEEDEPTVPMTTRLRKQAERERDRERERRTTEMISVSDGEEDAGRPSQWNVEQVFSYISSLPGGQDVAEEFRSQEIDGQALLLLTEDHLVSTMNLKLGPALKLCAHIKSLKDA